MKTFKYDCPYRMGEDSGLRSCYRTITVSDEGEANERIDEDCDESTHSVELVQVKRVLPVWARRVRKAFKTALSKLGWIDLLLISIPLTVIALFNLFVY